MMGSTNKPKDCTCTQDALDGEAPMCGPCETISALRAGIPLSVIEGRTKLSDHFSESYINSQRNRSNADDGSAE